MFRVGDTVRVVFNDFKNGYMHSYPIGTVGKVSFIEPKDGAIRVSLEKQTYGQWMHDSELELV